MKKATGILILVLLTAACVSAFVSCGEEYSEGLNFILLEDGTYGVRCGSVEGSRIVIPAERYGIPVTKVLSNFFTDKYIEYTDIEIYLPEGIEEICDEAFLNASVIGRIFISSTVTRIGSYAFKESGLSEIVFSEDAKTSLVGRAAFYGCHITEFIAPSQLNEIASEAFANCSELALIDLSATDQLIELPYMFAMNSSIEEVRLNKGLEIIGRQAFEGCALGSVSIPETVKKIEYGAFGFCYALKEVDISVDGALEVICENAFRDCFAIKDFILPKNLASIEENAFCGCNALLEIYDLTQNGLGELIGSEYLGIGGFGILAIHDSLDDGSILSVTDDGFLYLMTEDGYALVGYVGDGTEIRLPDTVCGENYYIAQYAFGGSAVTVVVIPEGVTAIGEGAFLKSSLASVNIPVSVATIGRNAFLGLKATITVEGETNWYEYHDNGVATHFADISEDLVTDENALWERTLKSGWY